MFIYLRRMNAGEFKIYLQEELVRRCRENPAYSLRAFARALEVEPSYLSKILRGQRPLTHKKINQFSELLGIKTQSLEMNAFQQLTLDRYALISDWYHFAILELLAIPDFQCSSSGVASALGIKVIEAQAALDRLKRLNMITQTRYGQWKNISGANTTLGTTIPERTLKTMQMQILDMAKKALGEVPMNARDQATMTFAIPTSLIPQAKERIKKFRRELNQFFGGSGLAPDQVYQFTTSLYPVSNIKNQKRRKS